MMTDSELNPTLGSYGNKNGMMFNLVLLVLLFAACIAVPVFASIWIHPVAGAGMAIIALYVWKTFVPPTPRLLQGFVCLAGMGAILGVLIECTIRAIW
ncbi:hypothetical protein CA54_21490 [Symmachiella macrocystis]|uniref:Uncharacterized protein n=1 Tax=Symmachiella macrocystis TaxID=2527985 RepID=A0A5C6BMR8_9PLAN|nr:hypothetical protein [Symmachiella macrocystis]TWU13315.1 hypothetical protein CA54_21490 [Symmachiella macrocystis]